MRRNFLVLALSIALLMLAATTAAAHEGHDDHAAIDAPVSRESTGVEIASDAAVALANSAGLAEARDVWGDDAAFLDQVDYQLTFRDQNDFMPKDPERIAAAMTSKPHTELSLSMGLSMAAAEETEMLRRDAVGDVFPDITKLVSGVDEHTYPEGVEPTYGPLFGGIAMDQHDGGAVRLAVTDASKVDVKAIEKMLDGVSKLVVIEQKYSYDEQADFRDRLGRALEEIGEAGILIRWTDKGRHIYVEAPNVEDAERAAAKSGVPLDAYTVREGRYTTAGFPGTNHSTGDQQPGLRIEVGSNYGVGGCTWGFNAHTNTFNYLVSAGHCPPTAYENYSGYISGQLVVEQRASGSSGGVVLANQGAYLVSKYSTANNTVDAMRISSSYADDNCYHGNPYFGNAAHCQWPMKHRASYMSWEIDVDRTCASLGSTNSYRCGYIFEEYVAGNDVAARIVGQLGDSGSGMKWDYRIDGILVRVGGNSSGNTSVIFGTAHMVQTRLGSHFNCAPSAAVKQPSQWGNCPVVNA